MIIKISRATATITDWSYLALLLGIDEADYDRIMTDIALSSHQRKAIITKWLANGEASWAVLVSALRDELVNKQGLANWIASEHPLRK